MENEDIKHEDLLEIILIYTDVDYTSIDGNLKTVFRIESLLDSLNFMSPQV